jgi:hypothetical protein
MLFFGPLIEVLYIKKLLSIEKMRQRPRNSRVHEAGCLLSLAMFRRSLLRNILSLSLLSWTVYGLTVH